MSIEATRAVRVEERLGNRLTRLERREDRLARRAARLEEAGIDPSETRIDERLARIGVLEENVKTRVDRLGSDGTKDRAQELSATPQRGSRGIDVSV